MPRLLLAALVALLAAPAALAQTCTTSWTNPAGGAWEAPGNWSDGVPDGLDTACISLAGTYTVAQSASDRTIGGLVLGGASGTQTLTTFNVFAVDGTTVVRPSGRWELLNRVPGGQDGFLTTGTATIEGVFVQNGGTTLLDGAGTFDVAPGGRWELRDQVSAGIESRPGTYRLRGTLDAAYTSTQTVNLPLDVQGGTIRVTQGRLDIRGGTLANATVDAAAGATMLLVSTAAAPFTVSGTLSGAPAGEVYFNGGTFGAVSGEVVLGVGGTGLLLGGSVNLTSAGGSFLNTGRLTHAETGSNFATLNGTTLRNTGRFVMPGRGFGFQNGGLFRNEVSGIAEIADGGGFGGVGGSAGRVENAGLLLANGAPNGPGSGATAGTVSVPYDGLAGSTIRVQTGRLDLQAGGTFRDAAFDVAAGTALLLAGGTPFTVSGTLSGAPAGDLIIGAPLAAGPGGATLALGGAGLALGANLRSAGGQFVNTGVLTWNGGTSATAVVLENRATVRLLARVPLLQGAVLRNVAGATAELFAFMEGDGRFDNAGLAVTGGAGFSASFGGRLRSLPGSEIRALRGGPRLDLDAPGSRTLPDGTTLTGTGRLLLPATLDIEGAVSPGTAEQPLATLGFFSAFRVALGGNARVLVDIDAGGRSDTLTVGFGSGGGNTRLGSTLVVRVRPGFTPAVGDAWTILTTQSPDGITGNFEQVVADGAPSGVAFVAERSADGASLVLRAVAAAPGGPIAVSAGAPVSGGRRTLFLSGPGVAGVSAARLICTDCLDSAAAGAFDATVTGTQTLKEVRFDLTDSRAFGFFDLVVQRPGQPDATFPVTVRPYLSGVFSRTRSQAGILIRPAGAPGQEYNFSRYDLLNRTNGPVAFPFVRLDRPAPDVVSMALASSHSSLDYRFYESDEAADPLALPLLSAAVPANGTTDFEIGLRIDPSGVLFPEQTRTGPDDDRLPFAQVQPLFFVSSSNTTFERAAVAVRDAVTGTGRSDLDGYLASVAASDPAALSAAVNTALLPGAQNETTFQVLTDSPVLFDDVLSVLSETVATPAGLADAAAPAFKTALLAAIAGLGEREKAAYAASRAASSAVRALYDGELSALGLTIGLEPRPGITAGISSFCISAVANRDRTVVGSPACPCEDVIESFSPAEAAAVGCTPPSGPADPNDKLADTDLTCEFGRVVVDGEEQTRCVRYFVPRARATEPVAYTIRFENLAVANAPAEFVTITDVIDPAFDIASLRIESTSSDSTFSYSVSGRTVTFRFVDINLPPNRTAPEGEGFVRYSVRPNLGLPDGTEIRNTADIVFDFNPAIATPTVLHEIRTVADLGVSITAPDFVVVGTPAPVSVTVGNIRGDAATAAAVTITTGGAVAQVTPSIGACVGTGPFVCTFGDLEASETATVEVAFGSAPAGTALTVSATVTTSAFDGFAANDTDLVSVGVATVGTDADPDVPRELTLSSPRPNPARGAATLRWGLPQAASVDVRVFDLLGREVARLAEGEQAAGWHEARWEAHVASGVYVVRLRVGDDVRTRRLTVVR